jgi:hypothetical protein
MFSTSRKRILACFHQETSMTISIAQARQICTKAELELVLKSTTRQIGTLDARELRAAVKRSRTLRDKWRDQTHTQTRGTKATAPEKLGDANARSAEKAQLFDETLNRFEKRLAKVDKQAGAASAPAERTTKRQRSAGHRAVRGSVRETLAQAADKLNAAAAPASSSAVATAGGDVAPATSSASTAPARKKKSSKKKSTAGGTKRAKVRPAAKTSGGSAGKVPAPERSKKAGLGKPAAGGKKPDLRATAQAKKSAVKRSGAPKIQAHVSSQNRRSQAKRNKR